MHPRPFNDHARLEALQGYRVLDTAAEPCFDRVTEIAKSVFGSPIAVISLIDEWRQWFKSRQGVDLCETHRDVAFCSHTILSDDFLVVPDATQDPRFRDNPLVTGEAHLRFYAGAPIITSSGLRLGVVCVLDSEPRPRPDQAQLAVLRNLAAMVIDLLEARRAANEPELLRGGAPSGEADAANRAKHEFLTLISHELRTPLHAVMGFGSLIAERTSDQESRGYAQEVCQSGQHLTSLIDRILEFSRAERGELTLKEEEVDLAQVADAARAAMTGSARLAGAELALEVHPGTPRLRGDGIQLRQVLLSLISNAVQAEARTVTIAIDPPAAEGLRLRVVDDGRGIDAAAVERVLDSFTVGDDVLKRRDEGLGLGLPLTRRLVELHGGRLTLVSDGPEQGTEAKILFPAWRIMDDLAEPEPRPEPQSRCA